MGDHEQLSATVTSRKAKALDYHQSLFSRLISSFTAPPSRYFIVLWTRVQIIFLLNKYFLQK